MKQFDIIIIGGGVIGLGAAWQLARAERKVAVFEAQRVAAGSSGAALGTLINPLPTRTGTFTQTMRQSVAAYDELIPLLEADSGEPVFHAQAGHIWLPQSIDNKQDLARCLEVEGSPLRLLSAKEAKQLEPNLQTGGEQAVYDPVSRHIDPAQFTFVLAAACKRLGVEVFEHAPVREIVREQDGKACGIQLVDGQQVQAAKIVVCAGLGASSLLKGVGMELPVKPVKGQGFLLKTDAPAVHRVVKIGKNAHLVPRTGNYVVLGTTSEPEAGFDMRPQQADFQRLLNESLPYVPLLESAKLCYAWAGLRPKGPKSKPYVGEVAEVPGLFAAAGHYKVGFYLMPWTAAQITKWALQ